MFHGFGIKLQGIAQVVLICVFSSFRNRSGPECSIVIDAFQTFRVGEAGFAFQKAQRVGSPTQVQIRIGQKGLVVLWRHAALLKILFNRVQGVKLVKHGIVQQVETEGWVIYGIRAP
ncbi:Uncharacterised protein [Candidatus Burarchaeum australiense]|nr:Uncharacterised protein [Candidatus Burarchaeum australiense]